MTRMSEASKILQPYLVRIGVWIPTSEKKNKLEIQTPAGSVSGPQNIPEKHRSPQKVWFLAVGWE